MYFFRIKNNCNIFHSGSGKLIRKLFLGVTLILLLLLSNHDLFCQSGQLTFEHISLEQGLSQSTVLSIIQDKEGYLWLGTQEGLNKYDGYSFTVYKNDPKDPNSLSDNWITVLFVDKDGTLWIGTNAGGLNKLDREHNRFVHYRHEENNPYSLSDDRILSIFEDGSGTLWVGTDGGGLNRFDMKNDQFENYQFEADNINYENKNNITAILEDYNGYLWWGTDGGGLYRMNWKTGAYQVFKSNPDDSTSLSNDRVLCLSQDGKGYLWIGTNGGGLNKFDPRTRQFKQYRMDLENPNSLSDDHVYTIVEDSNGRLWIGTDGGLNQYLPDQDQFLVIRNDLTEPTSLSNDMIRAIYEDRGGILWVGTYSGALNKFDSKKAAFKNYSLNPANPNSLSDKNVWSIFEDNSGKLWIGTNDGLNMLNRRTGKFSHFKNNPGDPNSVSSNIIRVVYQDRLGTIWVGTDGGGLNRYDITLNQFENFVNVPNNPKSISDNNIRCIYEDGEGELWIGTINGLNRFDRQARTFIRYQNNPDSPASLPGNHIRFVYEDSRGALWIGTFGGLSLYVRNKDEFISFKHNPSNPLSLSNDRVLCALEDRSHRFWVGTYGGGLDMLDRQEFIFEHFTVEDGLPNDAIYGVLEDSDGNLWISTNKGLSKFNPDTKVFKNYDVNDGLQSNEFNGNAFHKAKNGEMFFGGINGFTAFFPEKVQDNNHVPPVVLTAFKKYDKDVKLEEDLSIIRQLNLSYKDDFFSFEFAALDFTNPEKNQYAYKLEGFDKDWIYSENRRYANYTNLGGGTYVFRVKGSNNNGVWNENGTSLTIVITPPFWQTWWFRISIVFYLVMLVYVIIKVRMRSINAQKRKLELEVAQRTRELNQSNYELLRAKKDTDDILNNVEEGIFLVNQNFELGAQYSLALEDILHQSNLANYNFLELLRGRISEKVVQSTKEYLELMFRKDVDEETLAELNPLSEVELNLIDDDSWESSKYLSFNFQRIFDEDRIISLIATVADVTEQIILAKRLESTEKHTQKQMEWLVNILHIEPALLNEFIEGVQRELDHIDALLRFGDANKDYHQLLEEIYRAIHLVKGNATLLDLKFFANQAHQFEERINEIRQNAFIQGKDFVPLVLKLGEIRTNLNDVRNLIERISQFHQHFRPKRSYESELLIKSITNLINNLAKDLGKEVDFIHENFEAMSLPYRYRLLVKEILIQLVRNALHHGIETPEERIQLNKKPRAAIYLSSEQNDHHFILRFRDDGRGLQVEKLKERALALGKWKPGTIEAWGDKEIADLIFVSGISTEQNANLYAGRGVGMDLIRDKIKEAHGEIVVEFEEGAFCEFNITLNLKKANAKKASGPKRSKVARTKTKVVENIGN